MNKRYIILLILLGNGMFNAVAQNCNANFLGTKTLYKAPEKALSRAPSGFYPVFINHVGRHGARHLTKEVSASFAYQFLNHADSLNQLTADGQKLHQMVLKLSKVEHGRVKNISIEGENELKGLGERMYGNYSEVFKTPVKLEVAYTKEVRTKQSADAFLAGLKSSIKDSVRIKQFNDDVNLRFYDISPGYIVFQEKGPWMSQMDSLKKQVKLADVQQQITARWLQPAWLKKLSIEQKDHLVGDIFGFTTIAYSVIAEAKKEGFEPSSINFSNLFTCDELAVLSKIDDADDYYKKAPGIDNDGIQVRIAAPLLADFIRTTDAFINKPTVNAQLRFAHAETIAPFAALLNMDAASRTASKAIDFEKSWKAADVIPLSANIQWIVYQSGDDHLVKFLLNEKEVKIKGLKAMHGYYYDWKAARSFYMKKLAAMGLTPNSNMTNYLSEIK